MVGLNVLLLAILVGCDETATSQIRAVKRPLTVEAFEISRVNETEKTATYFGTIRPNRSLSLAFTHPGKIKSIVSSGQSVPKGELLADLDAGELEKQKERLQSQLLKTTEKQQTEQLQVQVKNLDDQIQANRIVAPFDCIVDQAFVFENGLVRPQSPVIRIIEAKNPRIKISLPSRIAKVLNESYEVYFLLDEKVLTGSLAEKSKMERAGNVVCWFNINSDLAPEQTQFGQTIEVRFNFRTGNSGFWVPIRALERSGEGVWSIFCVELVDQAEIVAKKQVTVVEISEDQALVDGELEDGDQIITDGIHRVVPGQKISTQTTQAVESSDEETSE